MYTNQKLTLQHLINAHNCANKIILAFIGLFLLSGQAWSQDIELSIEPSDTSICAGHSIVLFAEVSSASEIIFYEWSTWEVEVDVVEVSPNITTIYSVTVTDATGATATTQSVVNIIPMDVSIDVVSNTSCHGSIEATLMAIPTGTPPFVYSWSNGATDEINDILTSDTYFVTATDAIGCMAVSSQQITEPSPIDFSTTLSHPGCIGSGGGVILAPAYGGTPPYSYLWSDGHTQADRDNIPAGTYELTATDANNCTGTASYDIVNTSTDIAPMIDFDATILTHASCGSSDGAIDLVVLGGAEPLSINWFGSPANFSADTEDINDLESSTYSVYIYDDNGCNISADFEIENQGGSSMTIDMENSVFQNAYCIDQGTGYITLEISGGTPPYAYVWSNGSIGYHNTNLSPGEYYATVTDAANCEFVAGPINLEGPDNPLILDLENSFVTNASCYGASDGAITLAFNGESLPLYYEVNFENANGQSDDFELESLDALAAGQYDIVVIDANSCQIAAGGYTINQPDSLAYDETASIFTVDCSNTSSNLIAPAFSGGVLPFTYVWSNGSQASTLSNVEPGTYAVTVTDDCGYTQEHNYVISDNMTIDSENTVVQDAICFGEPIGSIHLEISGGVPPYSNIWSTGSTYFDIYNLLAGEYMATVTDATGCSFTTGPIIVGEPVAFTVESLATTDVSCYGANDGAIALAINGAMLPVIYEITFEDVNGQNNSLELESLENLVAGQYDIAVIDANGCYQDAGIFTINQPAMFAYDEMTSTFSVDCANTNTNLIAPVFSGGVSPVTYEWSNGSQSSTLNNVAPGTYTITATEGCGEIQEQSFIVSEIMTIDSENTVIQDVLCFGEPMGSIYLVINGGIEPYSYAWSHGDTRFYLTDLLAGEYVATVTDATGCQLIIDPILISEPSAPFALENASVTDVSCYGAIDGAILLEITGGVLPFSYEVSTFEEEIYSLDGLPAGEHDIVVIDFNACHLPVGTFTIEQPDQLTFDEEVSVFTVDCMNTSTNFISPVFNGGVLPITYEWNNGSQVSNLINVEPGTYILTVTDACNYTQEYTYFIQENMAIDLENTIFQNTPCAYEELGSIDLVISGGIPPYSYVWSNGYMGTNSYGLAPGEEYFATITDATSCTFVAGPMVIDGPENGFVYNAENATTSDVSCIGASDGSISLNFTGGIPPFNYEVDFVDVNGQIDALVLESLDGLAAGNYDIVAIDDNICHLAAGAFTINQPDVLAYNEEASLFMVDCTNPSNNLIAPAFSGGVLPIIYEWNNGSQASTLTNVEPGTYALTATDACDQTLERVFMISEDGEIITNLAEQICEGESFTIGGQSFTESGEYEVLLTTTNGLCDSLVRLSLAVFPLPSVNAGIDLRYCQHAEGQLVAAVSPMANFSWSPTVFLDDSLSLTPYVNTPINQTYTLTATLNGCINEDSVRVFVDSLLNPIADAGEDLVSCDLVVVELGGTPSATPPPANPTDEVSTYIWRHLNNNSIFSTVPNPEVFSDGTIDYELTVVSNEGCLDKDTVTITISPFLKPYALVTSVTCPRADDGSITLTPQGGTLPLEFSWTDDPDGNFGIERNNLTAGVYSFIITDALGCEKQGQAWVAEPLLVWNPIVIQPNCDNPIGGTIDLGLEVDALWNISWSNGVSDVTSQSGLEAGDYCVTVSQSEDCAFTRCFTIENLVEADCGTIAGILRQDVNEDCISQNGEPALSGWLVEARSANTIYHTLTNADGAYEMSLPLETYTLHPQPPGLAWDSCSPPATANLTSITDFISLDLSAPAPFTCPEMIVSFNTPFLRRCLTSSYHLHICSTGSAETGDYTLEFLLDEGLNYLSSSIAPSQINGNLLLWERPSLPPNSCYDFVVEVEVDCEAELGQAHCSTLYAYNDEIPLVCTPPNEEWSGANLQVVGNCDGEELSFVILNNSLFDMNESRSYQILQDTFILEQGQLPAIPTGGSTHFSLLSTGATYTFRVEQASGHPNGNTVVNTIEGCGVDENGNFTTGITELIEQQWGNPNSFILCENNIGSYDPNDKTGRPLGIGAANNIFPGTELNYKIRFQNTGTDTAFQVIIRDQLADELDVSTFRHGVASHDYTLALREDRTLVFTFDNIMLPDSSTNLPGSQGFVTFHIKPKANLPLGTPINNEAAIYFDFNEPIITNKTLHTINEGFLDFIDWIPEVPGLGLDWSFYPNPSEVTVHLEFKWDKPLDGYQLVAFDGQGRLLTQQELNGPHLDLDVSSWPQGSYLLQLWSREGQLVGSAQVVRQ